MILATLLLAVQIAAPPAADPPSEDEVVVAAQRLKRFRAITKKDRKTGDTICVIRRESGDPALDRGICDAMLACAPKIKRASDIQPCMAPAMQALLPTHKWTGGRARRED